MLSCAIMCMQSTPAECNLHYGAINFEVTAVESPVYLLLRDKDPGMYTYYYQIIGVLNSLNIKCFKLLIISHKLM